MAPAIVVVNPADNLTLTGNTTMTEFDSEPLPENIDVATRERAPLCYIYRGNPANAVMEYDLNQRDRLVLVDSMNEIGLGNEQTTVEQEFSYLIRYEPLESIRLNAPVAEDEIESVRIIVNGQEVDPDSIVRSVRTRATPSDKDVLPVPKSSTPSDTESVWEIPLPPMQLGEVSVRCSFTCSNRTGKDEPAVQWTLPLFAPLDGEQRSTQLRATSPPKSTAKILADDSWNVVETLDSNPNLVGESNLLFARTEKQPDRIEIEVKQIELEEVQSIVIERALCQTWLGPDSRQDRATFMLSAATSPIQIQLPPDANSEVAYVLLDGERVATDPEGLLLVDLSSVDRTGFCLEVAYSFSRRPSTGSMEIRMPFIKGSSWMHHVYWQLVTPSHEHLLSSSRHFLLDNEWQPAGLGWSRQPRLEQRQLETWAGASPLSLIHI